MKVEAILSTILLLSSLAGGCAAVSRGSRQQLYINTYDEKGNIVPCDCILSNDEGKVSTLSNRTVTVGRDKDILKVECENQDFVGNKTVYGKINMGFWAADFFLIDLCTISGLIDGMSGSWAEYPAMIDVQLNKKTPLVEPRQPDIGLESDQDNTL